MGSKVTVTYEGADVIIRVSGCKKVEDRTRRSGTAVSIAEHRKKAGMSQRDLAKKAGVTLQSVWNWEKRGSAPSRRSLSKVAQALGVATATLTRG